MARSSDAFRHFFMTVSLENVAMSNISESAEWQDLQSHYLDVRGLHMRDLFAKDSARFKKFSVSDCGILLDYSKNRITDETMQKLFALAKKADVLGQARKMFNGEKINTTEDRAVLHTALRLPRKGSIQLDGEEIVSQVHAEADHAAAFVDQVRNNKQSGRHIYSSNYFGNMAAINVTDKMKVEILMLPWFERLTHHEWPKV